MIAQLKKITLGVALGATALTIAAPAEAQHYGGYRGRDNGGTAVIAGVAGLAIGAALASSANRRGSGYYYDEGYAAPVVAYPGAYGGYYDGGYYGRDYRHYERGRGYGDRHWGDRYRGGYEGRGWDGYRR